ncbi:MAG: hypothetical protein VB071_07200 [Lawsonibacter sp.]|nr:hypothetical protein [Lawsonibacter sp.]
MEMGKNVLIVMLTCSAVWMASRSRILGPLAGLFQEEDAPIGAVQTQSGARADAARPLRLAVSLSGGAGQIRYGIQYDAVASDALFQQVGSLLVETLSSAGTPETVTRTQWEQAMDTAPGVVFDFQGQLPMPVLVGWLAGEDTTLDATVRRLVLTVWQGTVALYYRDEVTGQYYRCLSEVANESHLEEAVSSLTDNGAMYAFESALYENLDPDTLILGTTPAPAVYRAFNPMIGGRSALEGLLTDLGISVDASSFYPSGNEQVARSGSDSIRLSDQGRAVYEAGGEDGARFQVSARREEATLFESVEACRELAAATVGTRCGQARLYLMSTQEREDGLVVRFGYCLNGSTVQLEGDSAARFLVKNGQIIQFELNFRSYTNQEETSMVMPVRQAAAAMGALGLDGEELLLVYGDTGGDTAVAYWAAAGSRLPGER